MDTEGFAAPQLGLDDPPGVGARQAIDPADPGGGGYQATCTTSNFEQKNSAATRADRRYLDFEAMGLSLVWLRVARELGVDAFLAMWRILDAHPPHWHDTRGLRMDLRRYKAYIRFQRNRYILALHDAGADVAEIRKRVEVAFGEQLGDQHVSRTIRWMTKSERAADPRRRALPKRGERLR